MTSRKLFDTQLKVVSKANLCNYFVIIHGHHIIRGIRDASVTDYHIAGDLYIHP